MGVNKFNCEGYYDPTAYEALTKIEQEAKALRAFRGFGEEPGKRPYLLPLRRGSRVRTHRTAHLFHPIHE